MSDWLQFFFVEILAAFLRILPVPVSSWMARRAGDLAYLLLLKRREAAFLNIGRAFGNSLTVKRKKQIARLSFQSTALSILELFIIEKIEKETSSRFKISGGEILEQAFSKGKGVVLVIAHLGSWEYLSFLPYLTRQHWSVVVKSVRNPYLDRTIDRLRRVTTVVPIPKVSSIRGVLNELKSNHGVAILIDQWAGAEGLWLDFFDTQTSTTSIPSRLARKTGCALVPAFCLRESTGHYGIHICPPLDWNPENVDWEHAVTQDLNRILESLIRRYPEQWLWSHKRWKAKPAYSRTFTVS